MEKQNNINLLEWIKNQKEEIELLKERIRDLESSPIDFSYIRSIILKEEYPELKNNIKNYLTEGKNSNKLLTRLLYRKTRDGDTTEIFKKFCSNIKNTLTIIKLKDGKIIGGFTSLPWNDFTDVKSYDIESFLFNQYKKFPKIIKEIQSICCRYGYGWWSYCLGFRNNNMNKLIKNAGSIEDAYKDGNNILPNLKYTDEFDVSEVETFEIIYE